MKCIDHDNCLARKIKEILDVHPYVYRAIRVLMTMVLALHFFACLLWRIKVSLQIQLHASDA